jgi:hypothetical protein
LLFHGEGNDKPPGTCGARMMRGSANGRFLPQVFGFIQNQ